MYKILVASKSFGFGADRDYLLELFRKNACNPEFSSLEKVKNNLADYDGIIIGTEKMTREVFEKARNLKAVIKYGVGTDNIDKTVASEKDVKVFNMPGINAETVAEMALGLMFSLSRRIVEGDRLIRSSRWKRLIGSSVREKTLGVIGTGAIGTALVRFVRGLEMEILAYDINENKDVIDLGGRYVDLETLLRLADFVSLHLPLNEKTFHFIGEKELSLMKEGAFLINTSRGAIVDEIALFRALKEGKIAGAALDVFESKPSPGHDLLQLQNIVSTPHIAAYTGETLRRMDELCVNMLGRALLSDDTRA